MAHALEIEVTPKDTQSALVRNHKGCAMAVACKRKLKLDGVIISVGTAYLVKDGLAKRYRLPQSVSREVISFDRKGGFAPGEYKLLAPKQGNKLGQGGHSHPSRGSGKPFTKPHVTEGVRTILGAVRDIA